MRMKPKYSLFENWERKHWAILLNILLAIILLVIVAFTGAWVTSEGWNIISGWHIHKTFFGYWSIILGVGLWHYEVGNKWIARLFLTLGLVILFYDVVFFGVQTLIPIAPV
jgi:hypothetical protein